MYTLFSNFTMLMLATFDIVCLLFPIWIFWFILIVKLKEIKVVGGVDIFKRDVKWYILEDMRYAF
jgi:hypothetical protein